MPAFLKNPIVQGIVTVVAVIVVWRLVSNMLQKIPVVGPYLAAP